MNRRAFYRELLDAYYFSGGNLPSDIDRLSRIISVHTPSERSALAHAVASFFGEKGGRLTQDRADREIEKIRDKSLKAKASAIAMHRKHNDKETSVRSANAGANAGAAALLTKNQESITKLAGSGLKVKLKGGLVHPPTTDGEILPSAWQDMAEELEIPDDQIFRSWRKFKDTSAVPYRVDRWQAWIGRERVAGRSEDNA